MSPPLLHTGGVRASGPLGPGALPRHGTGLSPALRTPPATSTSRDSRSGASRAGAAPGSDPSLLVVGPGVLGQHLAKLWMDAHGPGTVAGLTQTDSNHARLRRLGIAPHSLADPPTSTFRDVVFSAPPSASADYPGEVARALERWSGEGAFVFTSSAAVYAVDGGEAAREDSPVVALGASPRTDRLLRAERSVRAAGGCVVRLVGLYHSLRGPHTFYLKQSGNVDRWGGALVNLVHYQDAAGLTLAVLQHRGPDGSPPRGETFVACDDEPITLQGIMDATMDLPRYAATAAGPLRFVGAPGSSVGKRMTNPATRRALGWEPRFKSFRAFMAGGAEDWYLELESALAA
ncbi:CPLD52 [Auxenochlorella protothecoides x Auxenochlorella symbiontica]